MELETTHQTVNYMSGVRVMTGVCALSAYEVHNLVLSFSRHTCIRDDDLELYKKLIRKILKKCSLRTSFHPGSVFIFSTTQYRNDAARRAMNGVPGVIALESQASLVFSSSVITLPIAAMMKSVGNTA
jgi:hypothetical protein